MTTISRGTAKALQRRRQELADKRGQSRSVVKDVVGSVTGPKDLSHNKKYLEGFGR